jgi:hypothetical protein
MSTKMRTVCVVALLVLGAGFFFVFAPVVPQVQAVPCYLQCSTLPVAHYSASLSFHFFNLGGVYQSCNGYQLIETTHASPWYCFGQK